MRRGWKQQQSETSPPSSTLWWLFISILYALLLLHLQHTSSYSSCSFSASSSHTSHFSSLIFSFSSSSPPFPLCPTSFSADASHFSPHAVPTPTFLSSFLHPFLPPSLTPSAAGGGRWIASSTCCCSSSTSYISPFFSFSSFLFPVFLLLNPWCLFFLCPPSHLISGVTSLPPPSSPPPLPLPTLFRLRSHFYEFRLPIAGTSRQHKEEKRREDGRKRTKEEQEGGKKRGLEKEKKKTWRMKRRRGRENRERRRRLAALVSSLTSARGSTHKDDVTPGNKNPTAAILERRRVRANRNRLEMSFTHQIITEPVDTPVHTWHLNLPHLINTFIRVFPANTGQHLTNKKTYLHAKGSLI